MQRIYIVGGHISEDQEKGNVFTNPSNEYAEFNMFLDPLAAKTVVESELDVTLIPLDAQRKVTSFGLVLKHLQQKLKTSESVFVHHLLSRLHNLQKRHKAYNHMVSDKTLNTRSSKDSTIKHCCELSGFSV